MSFTSNELEIVLLEHWNTNQPTRITSQLNFENNRLIILKN